MTEYDTFKKLRQRPFEEVARFLLSRRREDHTLFTAEGMREFEMHFGWTLADFNVIWCKTNSHPWEFKG